MIPVNKRWTVLIYADGNTELEPEIYRSFELIKNGPVPKDVDVVIQLARAPRELVLTLRPQALLPVKENWDGVRRYIINHQGGDYVEDLGNVNMADPRTLVDFITWGITNSPADRIIVILSGHGAGFAGVMGDYTHHYPLIMSINGLTGAIRQVHQNTGKHVDILILDACFMNMVEIWYEFAMAPEQPVKYLLAHLGITPSEGLPCHLIIGHLQDITYRKPDCYSPVTTGGYKYCKVNKVKKML